MQKNLIKTTSINFPKNSEKFTKPGSVQHEWSKVLQRQQQPALHIRTVASYFDAKKCLTITWRSTCRQSKRAVQLLPLTLKAALTRRSFFQTPIKNSKMKLCRVILWRKEIFENHLAISAGRLPSRRIAVFSKTCTQKVRIVYNALNVDPS